MKKLKILFNCEIDSLIDGIQINSKQVKNILIMKKDYQETTLSKNMN